MRMKNQVLIVDDDRAHRIMLKTLLGEWGHDIYEADDGAIAIQMVQQQPFDLVLMDIRMLNVSGLAALSQIKSYNPAIPVIIMTAYSSVDTAVEALKNGAYDYLTKPLDFDKLHITMDRAMEHCRLKAENRLLKKTIENQFDTQNIVGQSPGMLKLLNVASQAAPSEATVLITGESGTGKELIAGLIHYNSPRKKGPFVKINCAAITETLIESELFGHEKGAFTGASSLKKGRFEIAEQGTLFLDEIGELSPNLQVKLLRVLQERSFERVGGVAAHPLNARLIAATNKNLSQEMKSGHFREDLFYRLNVVYFLLPPLRKRYEDIPLLASHFLKKYAEENASKIEVTQINQDVLRLFYDYEWPGNIRELENIIERGVILSSSDTINPIDIPPELRGNTQKTFNLDDISIQSSLPETLSLIEKHLIQRALAHANNVQATAAKLLGIKKSLLHYKIKNYQIQVGSKQK
jgi:DNA-binding NtrC family response regulator